MSLRRRLAEFGFESNDDYTFQVDCLMRAEVSHLRSLQIAGESGRRKTEKKGSDPFFWSNR